MAVTSGIPTGMRREVLNENVHDGQGSCSQIPFSLFPHTSPVSKHPVHVRPLPGWHIAFSGYMQNGVLSPSPQPSSSPPAFSIFISGTNTYPTDAIKSLEFIPNSLPLISPPQRQLSVNISSSVLIICQIHHFFTFSPSLPRATAPLSCLSRAISF